MKFGKGTRYKDKHGRRICYGDILHVEEYPDKYVGGSYDYEGIVEFDENWRQTVVVYYDMSMIWESVPLCRFPVNGREILRRGERYIFGEKGFGYGNKNGVACHVPSVLERLLAGQVKIDEQSHG